MATVLQHPFGTSAFGDFLRTARERRGLTLQQISNETKIPRRLLESLEHGDLGAVPAGMYQRAEIRAYAKAVGLDQTLALSELERALGTRESSSDRGSGAEGERDGVFRRPYLMLALAGAIAVIAIAAWYGRMTTSPSAERSQSDRATQPAATRPAETPSPQPVADDATANNSAAVARANATGGADGIGGAQAPPPQVVTNGVTGATPATVATAPLITELVVVTDPPGARVTVDGIGRGTTPVTIRYLSAGEKRVRVLKEGFPAQERTIRLAPARTATTVTIPLQNAAP